MYGEKSPLEDLNVNGAAVTPTAPSHDVPPE